MSSHQVVSDLELKETDGFLLYTPFLGITLHGLDLWNYLSLPVRIFIVVQLFKSPTFDTTFTLRQFSVFDPPVPYFMVTKPSIRSLHHRTPNYVYGDLVGIDENIDRTSSTHLTQTYRCPNIFCRHILKNDIHK